MSKERTITLTDEEWRGVTMALVKRIDALEAWPAEHGYDAPSDDDKQVIEWTRTLLRKLHAELQK